MAEQTVKDDSTSKKEPVSWIDFLGTYSDIFPPELSVIKSPLNDGPAVIAELTRILDSQENLQLIYKNFTDHMDKEGSGKRRKFPSEVELDRKVIFKEKLLKIARDNVEYFSGRKSWKSGATCFTDWTEEECKRCC